jgi:segregation and condensation protein A
VIVRFLALLELFKQGYVRFDQADRFGDIEITWLGAPERRREGGADGSRLL